jgi:hypothetical protein
LALCPAKYFPTIAGGRRFAHDILLAVLDPAGSTGAVVDPVLGSTGDDVVGRSSPCFPHPIIATSTVASAETFVVMHKAISPRVLIMAAASCTTLASPDEQAATRIRARAPLRVECSDG